MAAAATAPPTPAKGGEGTAKGDEAEEESAVEAAVTEKAEDPAVEGAPCVLAPETEGAAEQDATEEGYEDEEEGDEEETKGDGPAAPALLPLPLPLLARSAKAGSGAGGGGDAEGSGMPRAPASGAAAAPSAVESPLPLPLLLFGLWPAASPQSLRARGVGWTPRLG